ncbi:hypothetical protein GCM10011383_45540 [Hymenobacter cavernae]|uniref:Peptidase M1 membrane alanine aminopeptidase domain-containing protein n=1 Tax=Hymenobacter cavernae TaxID=2044852 RepID=A0ABQ1UYZ1_9BACT|nr:hypothetical protein GCM10011383_45540 [Hymenobacter cavernae]
MWLFVSYPAIFNIGRGEYGLKAMFNEQTSSEFKSFMAHELGHYYFGTYKVFNSALGDAFSEGFTEYMALNLTKNMLPDSIYQQKLTRKIDKLKNSKLFLFQKLLQKKPIITGSSTCIITLPLSSPLFSEK